MDEFAILYTNREYGAYDLQSLNSTLPLHPLGVQKSQRIFKQVS